MPAFRPPLAPFMGVNKDLSSSDLPDGAVTDALNVRFREGAAEAFLGQTEAYPTAPIPPISAFPVRIGDARYWIVCGTAEVYCVTGRPAVWTKITRASGVYAATLERRWNGGVLNGLPVLNNGIDPPQMWSPVGTGQKLQTLSAWPANTTCRHLITFGVTLVALDETIGGVRYPHRVHWSHPADPGTVPITWDEADASKLAGFRDLEGASPIVGALPLREQVIIYKETTTHRMQDDGAGGFAFHEVFSSSGMLAPGCVVEVDGSHVVLTTNDVIIHDGNTLQSVIDKGMRRWLFKHINQLTEASKNACFLVRNIYFNEVWVCFPELGQAMCTMALVFNFKDKTLALKELPNVVSGNTGQVDDSANLIWLGDDEAWEDDTSAWLENEFGATLERTMLCAPGRGLVLVDSKTRNFGQPMRCTMERTGLAFGDPNRVKKIRRLRLRAKGPAGRVLMVQVGGQMVRDGPIKWSAAQPFRIQVDTGICALAAGRFLAYRIVGPGNWRLEGGEPEFVLMGTV